MDPPSHLEILEELNLYGFETQPLGSDEEIYSPYTTPSSLCEELNLEQPSRELLSSWLSEEAHEQPPPQTDHPDFISLVPHLDANEFRPILELRATIDPLYEFQLQYLYGWYQEIIFQIENYIMEQKYSVGSDPHLLLLLNHASNKYTQEANTVFLKKIQHITELAKSRPRLPPKHKHRLLPSQTQALQQCKFTRAFHI